MKEKDRQVLEKIYNHVLLVLKYCENSDTLDDFQTDSMRVDACVFNLMQIGELAKISLTDECKETITSIP